MIIFMERGDVERRKTAEVLITIVRHRVFVVIHGRLIADQGRDFLTSL